jgi:hypothetical protein
MAANCGSMFAGQLHTVPLHGRVKDEVTLENSSNCFLFTGFCFFYKTANEAIVNVRTVASLTKEPKFVSDYQELIDFPFRYSTGYYSTGYNQHLQV